MSPAPAKVLVSAGEPSGDLLGGKLIEALHRLRPDLRFEGCGGPHMAAAGLEILFDISRLSAMGFLEVARAVPQHLRLQREIVRRAVAGRYPLAVLIDYPGFHLRLGEALRRAGVPVLQYVAPQLWAWRSQRLPKLVRAVDRIALVLPFEEAWFSERGVAGTYVGHPALDQRWPTAEEARVRLGLPPEVPVLGMFPGSRDAEISRNWPLFRDVASRISADGCCHSVIVAGTAGGYYPDATGMSVHRGSSDLVLAASTAVLVKSGTTTLEAALAGVPMVVAYRTARTTYEIARRMMTVPWISLVNLILAEPLVPEFWRLPVHAVDVAERVRRLLELSSTDARVQRDGFQRLRARLGPAGVSERVAALALELGRC